MDEALRVAAVQANAGLIEDIERAYKRRAKRGTEVDALTLATRQAIRQTIEREISQAHIQEELQAVVDLREQTLTHAGIVLRELQLGKPFLQPYNGHLHQVGDAATAYLHILSLRLQTRTMTLGTHRFTTIAAQHHAILNLILIFLHHLEEAVDTGLFLLLTIRRQTVPQPVFLLLGEVVVRLEDGEIVGRSMLDEPVLPLTHLLSVPGNDAAVIDRQRRIGDDQTLIDADYAAKALTLRTGTHRRVEGEGLVGGLFESDAVGLEACTEIIAQTRWENHQAQLTLPFVEGGLG